MKLTKNQFWQNFFHNKNKDHGRKHEVSNNNIYHEFESKYSIESKSNKNEAPVRPRNNSLCANRNISYYQERKGTRMNFFFYKRFRIIFFYLLKSFGSR